MQKLACIKQLKYDRQKELKPPKCCNGLSLSLRRPIEWYLKRNNVPIPSIEAILNNFHSLMKHSHHMR
jgi:hypothetical protein